MKKGDLVIVSLAIGAFIFAVFAYTEKRGSYSQMEMKRKLQVVAVIRESDCVKCIENVLCYWKNIEEDFASVGVQTRIIFCRDTETFRAEELEYLCRPPDDLEIINYSRVKNAPFMPLNTPSVFIISADHFLYLQPIFLDTKIEEVHPELRRVIGQFLPKTT